MFIKHPIWGIIELLIEAAYLDAREDSPVAIAPTRREPISPIIRTGVSPP